MPPLVASRHHSERRLALWPERFNFALTNLANPTVTNSKIHWGLFFARTPMSDDDDDEIPSHSDMDKAFCARMRAAIAAGLESAPVGVITTPGTSNPKYVPPEPPWPLASPLVDMGFF
jgi:hypothetical protein